MMEITMLFFLLFVGCFGSKVKYLDNASRLSPTASTIDEIKRIQLRKSDLFENIDHDDFNPLLLNGTRGLPGLEIRINPNGFLFASLLASPIINNEIRRLRLPLSKKCFPMLDGCVTISNVTISRYRCPQMVSLHPSPPNRLVLAIRNLDFEMKANVNGEIGMILPVILNNTVSIGVHQISATIQLTIYRTLDGSAHFRSIRCYVSVGFTDVFFKNGGLLGDVFNSNFRNIVAQQIRKQFPIRFCKMIRYIVEEKINIPLNIISKTIPLKKLAYSAEKTLNTTELGNLIDDNMHQVGDMQSSTSHNGPLQRVTLSSTSSMSDTDVREMETSNLDSCVDCNPSNKLTSLQNFSALSDYFDKILSDVKLNMHLMKVFATPDHFQIGFLAAFGTEEIDKIPFYPFPMHFPKFSSDKQMLDVLISDYTANTLLYYLHKHGFLMFQIGPETEKIGELLKTTCADDYDELDDFNVDDEDFDESEKNSTTISPKFIKRRKRSTVEESSNTDDDIDNNDNDASRKDDDFFGNLGICLGDFMPAIRENYPKKSINIKIYSSSAPSVILMAENNGTVRINLEFEAAFYVDDNNDKIGTMIISSTIDGNVQILGKRINITISIQSLKFIDKEQAFGLPTDALDNLAALAREVISQLANSFVLDGFDVKLDDTTLSFLLVNSQFTITDHAVHISTDFAIPTSFLGNSSSTICRRF